VLGAIGGLVLGAAVTGLIFGLVVTPTARTDAAAASFAEGQKQGFDDGQKQGLVDGKKAALDEIHSEQQAEQAAADAEVQDAMDALGSAAKICGDGLKTLTLSNDKASVMVDSKNQDDDKSTTAIICMNMLLGAPDSLASKMSDTTAMAGAQDMSWDHYSARWTFHPDNGLDVIYEFTG